MRTLLVSYDLTNPALNETYVTGALMGLGEAWARPLANVWYLRTHATEDEVEARLARLLDDCDGLLVQETRGEAVLTNTGLRWFRQRRRAEHGGSGLGEAGNIVAFAPMAGANDTARDADDMRLAS